MTGMGRSAAAILWCAGLLAGRVTPAAASGTALDTLVAAERSFAALSVELGMRVAFLANLAPDAVVFRPGPVNGRQVWHARANPAATLSWAPDYAEISGDGDLGVTSGPWEWRPAPERNQPNAYGHFNSVWRRGKDGAWKVVADMGIQHEKPAVGLEAVDVVSGPVHPRPKPLPPDFGSVVVGGPLFSGSIDLAPGPGYVPLRDRLMAAAITDMMTAERTLVFVIRNRGAGQAYAASAADDVRICREGAFPMVGLSAASDAISKRGRRVELAPRGHGMASSRDLGYSYGLLISRASASARPDTASYLHVWRRRSGDGEWKLALDAENEFGAK